MANQISWKSNETIAKQLQKKFSLSHAHVALTKGQDYQDVYKHVQFTSDSYHVNFD